MEVIFTAILGEVASRSISLLTGKYSQGKTTPVADEVQHNLQILLLRVRAGIEGERGISNRDMVEQRCPGAGTT